MSGGDEDRDPEKRRDRHQRAAATGAGTAVGAIVAGPPGVILGAMLGPLLEPVVAKVWEEVSADGRRRAGETLAAARGVLDCEPEELDVMLRASDRTRLLAGIALSAATRTAWPAKVGTLGRSLASGLLAEDDSQIDTEQLIIAANRRHRCSASFPAGGPRLPGTAIHRGRNVRAAPGSRNPRTR